MMSTDAPTFPPMFRQTDRQMNKVKPKCPPLWNILSKLMLNRVTYPDCSDISKKEKKMLKNQ